MNASAPAVPPESVPDHVHPGSIPVEGGGKVNITYDIKNFNETYVYDYTREPLPHHLVRAAIKDELD